MNIFAKMFNRFTAFTAKEALDNTTPNATQYAFDKIDEAVKLGKTTCMVNNHCRMPIDTIKTLIENGFDIRFNHFEHDDTWLFFAEWSEKASGKIFHEEIRDSRKISFEELVTMLTMNENDQRIIEEEEEEDN